MMDSESVRPLTSLSRLQKIDQLRENNIDAYLPLPQLVAVGDQSSGKSSLLETLTGIPFAHGQELCTRYVTQITHRREDHTRINISIIPGPQAKPVCKRLRESYHREVQTTAELRISFPIILEEVNTYMNIKTPNNPAGRVTFSEDILKIEKCGPDEDYLTIIDVPGIFRTTTEGVTTDEDRALVKDMVQRYIKDDRTIILAVLPSNVDVATQEILALAEESDQTGERTLGILTKPDLLRERSAKLAVCSLVEGRRKPLNLGYYVVRNRGGDDDDDDDDNTCVSKREAMFCKLPWCNLPEDRVGVSALRERLQELLGQIIDRDFPQLRAETRQALEETEKELSDLGPPRHTEREQQLYLADIAGKFQNLVRAGLDADYSSHPAFDRIELRLITAIVDTTDRFNADFGHFSQTYRFQADEAIRPESPVIVFTPEPCWAHESDAGTISDLANIDVLRPEAFPDLHKVIVLDWYTGSPKTGILNWIESLHRRCRGIELGTFGNNVISTVFRGQSVKWESMTKQYLSKVIYIIHRFIVTALEEVCTDAEVREELVSAMLSDLLAKYEDAMKRAIFLVNVERDLKPYTLNQYFNNTHQDLYGARIKDTLRLHAREENDNQWRQIIIGLSSVQPAVSSKSSAEHTKESIHDIVEAYYQVARKRFIDNVFSQAVDYELLSGPASPLRLFCEQWVLKVDNDKLLAIAGESRRTRDRRQRLKRKAEVLEDAMSILY